MATRNSERYLRPLLDSLARQTHAPCELVVRDDASEDSTPRLLEEFARSAPFPVRLERFERRRGPVDAVLAAAGDCRGDAVAFCDADDVWLEGKLSTCARELEDTGAQLVLHTVRLVDAGLNDLGRSWPAIPGTRIVPPLGLTGLEVDGPGIAIVFRRALLSVADAERRPPSKYDVAAGMFHDEWSLFLAGVLGSIRLLSEPLVLYRQHGENASGGPADRRRDLTLRPAMDDYRRGAEHTAACAEYLERTRTEDPAIAERLAAGARAYSRMAESWRMRASLYEAADRRSRARLLRRLLAMRAYRSRIEGGFGGRALGKDLLAGVAMRIPAGAS